MGPQFGVLRDNFIEIGYALEMGQPNLVANWAGTRLYASSTGWGRLWRWFYALTALFSRHDFKHVRFLQAVKKTHSLFLEQLPQFERVFKELLEALQQDESDPQLSKTFFKRRRNMIELSDSLVAVSRSENFGKINALFASHLEGDLMLPLQAQKLFDQIEHLQQLIDLSLVPTPLPFVALTKVAHRQAVSFIEKRVLLRWIEDLNESGVTVSQLHRALHAIMEATQLPFEKGNLAYFEGELDKLGCALFLQEDGEHLHWRDGLLPGETVKCNETPYVIAERLSGDAESDFMYFAIQGEPEKVLLVGKGAAFTLLEGRRELSEKWDKVTEAALIDTDYFGRCMIREKLGARVVDTEWKSWETLDPQDKPKLDALISFVKGFISESGMPKQFKWEALRWDAQGRVRSERAALKGFLNYHKLEEELYNLSHGSLLIYHELMLQSGMATHPVSRYTRKLLLDVLHGVPADAYEMAAFYSLSSQHESVAHADSLLKSLFRLKKCALDRISENYELPYSLEILEKVMKSHLTNVIQEFPFLSAHEEEFLALLIQRLLSLEELLMKEEQLEQLKPQLLEELHAISTFEGLLEAGGPFHRHGLYNFHQISSFILTNYKNEVELKRFSEHYYPGNK